MIFVTLGTQDKPFKRLLDMLEAADVKEKIVVQAGFTPYASEKMQIFAYLPSEQLDALIAEADIIVCHGGVGTIMKALKLQKKIIACPRLAKYGEHQNDHQLQLVSSFAEKGYLLPWLEGESFDDKYQAIQSFAPQPFASNAERFKARFSDYLKSL